MKRFLTLAVVGLLGLAASTQAAGLTGCCKPHCIEIPPPDCPDCSGPCDGFRFPALCHNACKYISELESCTCCERIKAVKKLGSRLHADFCCEPEVLTALIHALQCDPCWEVREAAAWSILKQGARTEQGVLALFIASLLDPNWVVRDRAAEALDILTVGRRSCFKATLEQGDKMIVDLRKAGYKPGTANCAVIFGGCALGSVPTTAPAPLKVSEALPLPTGR